MEAIFYLIFLLISLLITAIFTRWLFRIDEIVILLHQLLENLKDNDKQNSVLIQQNNEIIRLLDE
jgi:hypothetical protein